MKRVLVLSLLSLMTLMASGQERAVLSKGFKFSVGVGAKYSFIRGEADFSPELGFAYRLDDKQMFGLGIMYDFPYGWDSVYFNYTRDFLNKPTSPYLEARIGATGYSEHRLGSYLGLQGGYRFLLGNKVPLRVGLTGDFYSAKAIVSLGLVLRTEF